MTSIYRIVVVIFVIKNVIGQLRIDPLVKTNVGLIKGLRASDGDYSMFLGIPYAKIDEKNPFGDAIPHPPFDNTFEAYDDSITCPQVNQGIAMGTLDCLHLNVYVPTNATSKNHLPVMVFIHGGAFERGATSRRRLSPKFLVQHDVIVIILTYRIGVYGFICLNTPKAPGNQGLKDQYIALMWIKNNIESFGGDVEKITLFGQSAGAHSIDLQLTSSKEKMYNNVILMSGSAVAATVLYEPDKAAPEKISSLLGLNTSDTDEALTYLSKIDPKLVVAAAKDLDIVFKPCVEAKFDNIEPFLTSYWINAKVPTVKNVPVMISFTEDEKAPTHMYKEPEYYENLDLVSEHLNRTFIFSDEEFVAMKNLVLNYYFGDEEINKNVQWGVTRFDSDFTYTHPVQRTIKKYLENEAGNIYYYMFSYVGNRNDISTKDEVTGTACCASHADDLFYIFDTELRPEFSENDQLIMQRLTTMFTNFAKYSDPTPDTSDLIPVKWLPLTKDKYYYLNVNTKLTVRSRPQHSRMAFWDLFYKHNKQFQRWYKE